MIDILKEAARDGGEVLKKYFRGAIVTKEKTSFHDIVTQADVEAQNVIVKTLTDLMRKKGISSFGFIGEEDLKTNETSEYVFIIDPLDGTSNFAKGWPFFCVSIALAKNEEIIAGVIYDVMRDTLYWAEHGKGSYKNTTRLPNLPEKLLQNEIFVIHLSSKFETRQAELKMLDVAVEHMHGVRMVGSITLKLSWMADGLIGATNGYTYIWDIAAAKLILEEVGGVVLDADTGKPLVLDFKDLDKRPNFIAGEKKVLHDFIQLLKK